MEFLKYQHVEKFGNKEAEGIEFGECYIFPKIDGTNGSIWHNETIRAGSRNRELSIEEDNAGFLEWTKKQLNIIELLNKYPNLRLYGEWLVPHSLKTYRDDAWKRFYVFDVMDSENYLNYDEYSELLETFKIDYIMPIAKIKNPTYTKLVEYLDKNDFLIKDGSGVGEGIVIKNYNYKNKFGRVVWAKIVRSEFKEQNKKAFGIAEHKEKDHIEKIIVEEFLTVYMIEKVYNKIKIDNDGWESKKIPELFNRCYYDLIVEESYNFVKKYKNPTINYSIIFHYLVAKIKENIDI